MYSLVSRTMRAFSVLLALATLLAGIFDPLAMALGFDQPARLSACLAILAGTVLLDRWLARMAFLEALAAVRDAPDPD